MRAGLEPEQGAFIDLVEDVLRSTTGLRYELSIADPADLEYVDAPYAVFDIETNPAYELTVSIELATADFRVRVNGDDFSFPLDDPRKVTRWIDRRCGDVEQLVTGDLKLEVESIFGYDLSSDLYAGVDDRWVEIAERDDGLGWIGLAAWLLPFGMSPISTREIEFRRWYEAGGADAARPRSGSRSAHSCGS